MLFSLVQKNLVNKVSHLNPLSRKNNSCMLRMPMFSQGNAKVKTNDFEIFFSDIITGSQPIVRLDAIATKTTNVRTPS